MAALNSRLADSVRAHRVDIDRKVAELRRSNERYAKQAAKEADVLAARAGVKRGGFASPATSRSASLTKLPPASPSSSSLGSPSSAPPLSSVTTSDVGIPIPNQASEVKEDHLTGLKRTFMPSPYPMPLVRPPAPETKLSSPRRNGSTDSVEGRRTRKVTFIDPSPVPVASTSSNGEDAASEASETESKSASEVRVS
jgi:hypothetical protein